MVNRITVFLVVGLTMIGASETSLVNQRLKLFDYDQIDFTAITTDDEQCSADMKVIVEALKTRSTWALKSEK